MRSWIERLCASRDFDAIVSNWPQAVKTPHGIVIPKVVRIAPGIAVDAEIHPGCSVIFRPAIGGRTSYRSARRRILEFLEDAIGSLSSPEDRLVDVGDVALEEEWGDFAVVIRPRSPGRSHVTP